MSNRRTFLSALLAVPLAPLVRRPAYERPSIREFGRGTLAMLHGREAVAPRAEWSDPERWRYLRGAWWRR